MKNTNEENSQAVFLEAVLREDIEQIKLFIEQEIDVNFLDEDGKSPLYNAIYYKISPEVCRLLIQAGADVNFTFKEGFTIWSQLIYYADDIQRFNEERDALAKEIIKSGRLNHQEGNYYKRMLLAIELEGVNTNEKEIVGEGNICDEESSE